MQTFDEYQKFTNETAVFNDRVKEISNELEGDYMADLIGDVYAALGLAGEAGEVANKMKKVIRDQGGVTSEESRLAIIDELGDVMWYVAQLSSRLGYSLQDVVDKNYQKLMDRASRDAIKGEGDNR